MKYVTKLMLACTLTLLPLLGFANSASRLLNTMFNPQLKAATTACSFQTQTTDVFCKCIRDQCLAKTHSPKRCGTDGNGGLKQQIEDSGRDYAFLCRYYARNDMDNCIADLKYFMANC